MSKLAIIAGLGVGAYLFATRTAAGRSLASKLFPSSGRKPCCADCADKGA